MGLSNRRQKLVPDVRKTLRNISVRFVVSMTMMVSKKAYITVMKAAACVLSDHPPPIFTVSRVEVVSTSTSKIITNADQTGSNKTVQSASMICSDQGWAFKSFAVATQCMELAVNNMCRRRFPVRFANGL